MIGLTLPAGYIGLIREELPDGKQRVELIKTDGTRERKAERDSGKDDWTDRLPAVSLPLSPKLP